MITADLISYIRKQLDRNVPKGLVLAKLSKAGWIEEDIEEGFEKVTTEIDKENRESENIIHSESFDLKAKEGEPFSSDRYREPVGEGEPLAKTEIPLIKKLEPAIKSETKEEPKIEKKEIEDVAKTEEEKQSAQTTSIELQELELPQGEIKLEKAKVWIPQSIPVKNTTGEMDDLVVKTEELSKPEEKAKEEISADASIVDEFVKTETPEKKEEPKRDYSLDSLPKIAILSTYPKDVLKVKQDMEEEAKQGTVFDPKPARSMKISKWAIIIPIIILILGAGAWAIASGMVNIKNIKIPLIKKDPRVLILNNSKILSSLKSYKTETTVEVSAPSFASISAGLLAGEAVTSLDKDYIALNAVGRVSQREKGFLSDNSVLIKGSVLQNFINTNIKNDGTNLYVNVPDLSVLLKEDAPTPSIVKVNEQEFANIPSLFGPKVETLLSKINLYKLLSSGISSYIDKDTLGTYDELIKGVEITEKGVESIKGVETYHYSVNPDRQLFKKLLIKIFDRFTVSLDEETKEQLSTLISSTTVNSFDVWVGKGDNTIYQYNIVLDTPLSKVIGFEDKSIGDNQVRVSWKTTYFDFNVTNEILIPESSSSASEFIKSAKIKKMKEQVSSFAVLATSLYKAEKAYGTRANSSGSCMSPTAGSLFSPTGHPKSATLSVGPISLLLDEILTTTNGFGSCYSSPSAWSFTVPLSDVYEPSSVIESYSSFYCVDSKGTKTEITSLPKGTSCPAQVQL